jgi:hypothetical protein
MDMHDIYIGYSIELVGTYESDFVCGEITIYFFMLGILSMIHSPDR